MTRTTMRMSLTAAAALWTVAAFGQGDYEAVRYRTNEMIEMRDGVRLATDIYRPARDGKVLDDPRPVLLQRTPYDKSRGSLVESAEYFASHGYVVAVQDLRGRFASEGDYVKYIGNARDGYDTIEALAALTYTNGKVGMWGTSYAAHVQANAAKLRPPSLATIVLNMGGMENAWDHKVRNNGAFEMQQLTWAFRNLRAETDDPVVRAALDEASIHDWVQALPFRRGLNPLSVAPEFESYILDMMTKADYDEYWMHVDLNWKEYYDETADIPLVLVSGWYDSYAAGTVRNFQGLAPRLDSPVNLVMGPWTHGGNTRSYAGDVDFGEDAAMADFHREFHLRWFDQHLRGGPGPGGDLVRVFVMGTGDGSKNADGRLVHGGYWREGREWPLPGTEPRPYYLHGDGTLSTTAPSAGGGGTTYTFDPRHPVPTIGGAFSSSAPVFDPGAYHQAEAERFFGSEEPYLPLKARPDVLTFQTAPLEEDVEVVGSIVVNLHVSSTAPDTDFTVKLVDVYPPSEDYPSGFEMNLTDGILRARYREGPRRPILMEPGEIYRLRIEPFPTANVFKKGHRIRLDVSSSNFPRFDVNPNTGEPLGRNRRIATADNSVHHESAHPSHVVLPIVPTARDER